MGISILSTLNTRQRGRAMSLVDQSQVSSYEGLGLKSSLHAHFILCNLKVGSAGWQTEACMAVSIGAVGFQSCILQLTCISKLLGSGC